MSMLHQELRCEMVGLTCGRGMEERREADLDGISCLEGSTKLHEEYGHMEFESSSSPVHPTFLPMSSVDFLPLRTSVSSSVKLELSLIRVFQRSKFRCMPLLLCLVLVNALWLSLSSHSRGLFKVEPLAVTDVLNVKDRKTEDDAKVLTSDIGGTIK